MKSIRDKFWNTLIKTDSTVEPLLAQFVIRPVKLSDITLKVVHKLGVAFYNEKT